MRRIPFIAIALLLSGSLPAWAQNAFVGYFALGTGNGSWSELSASGYSRQPVTLGPLANGTTKTANGATFGPAGSSWPTVTEHALYDAPTGGNLIAWWSIRNPATIVAGGSVTVPNTIALTFSDLKTYSSVGPAFAQQWLPGTSIGTTAGGNPITAGSNLVTAAGSISALTNNYLSPTTEVCAGVVQGEAGLATGSNGPVLMNYIVARCPYGASSLQLVYTGWRLTQASPGETNLVDPVTKNIGVQIAGSGNIIPVTFGGQRPGHLGTVTAAGVSVTVGQMVSDPVPINCPVGCQIMIGEYTQQGTGQHIAFSGGIGPSSINALARVSTAAGSTTDLSLSSPSGQPLYPFGGTALRFGPAAVIGTPVTKGPTACIIGDSRASGIGAGGFGVSAGSVLSGGTGYTSADIGKAVSLTGEINSLSVGEHAQFLITNVNSGTGAVSAIAPYITGTYNSTQSGQGAIASSSGTTGGGTAGSGLTITFYSGPGYDDGDSDDNKGFVARGLSTVPYVKIAVASATQAGWANRNYSRMALIKTVGCSTVLVEMGINDISGGTTTSALETQMTAMSVQLHAAGVKKVVFLTLLPETNDSTGFAGASTQAAYTNEANRKQYNTDVRNKAFAGVDDFIDTAAAIEVNSSNVLTINGGNWLTNGTVGYCTIDGVHPTTVCHALAAAPITAYVSAGGLQ